MAEEGALFRHAITQTGWTKAATPSVMASLYPTTHGVHDIADRLPASVTTIAEVYRQAGYATLSFSSVAFTGQFTNLHQGFEELHESESIAGRAGPRGSKTAREYVDRFLEWLDGHRDVPVFVYLHFFDPHSPYEPNPPFDTMWADPEGRAAYLRQQEALKKAVSDAFLAQRGMATPAELAKARVDAEAFLRYSKDWYDGSIRGMDTEIGRLVERLRDLGLAERTALAFYADHGEEFHDHGRMWHGQSVYGEMIRVPLILWAPGRVPGGHRVEEPVELVNIMPTLLEMSGLPDPKSVQGQSMQPLLRGRPRPGDVVAAAAWHRRPLIAEKQPMGVDEFPNAGQSYAIIDSRWKLIHNLRRPPEARVRALRLLRRSLRPEGPGRGAPRGGEPAGAALGEWQKSAQASRPKPEPESERLSPEQLERLRGLGYVR
jgi:arylsulfatase A-like enzyme